MGMIRVAPLLLAAIAAPALAQLDDPAARAGRWAEVRAAIFGARPVADAGASVMLDAPVRAEDAALAPLTVALSDPTLAALHLVIDENPSPYAAQLRFGPAADRSRVTFRVRINGYTNVHAVAEDAAGGLATATRFVKAAGGCSAPIGVTDEQAMAGMGEMRLRFDPVRPGAPVRALLMIRHPNFTGMQVNQLTRLTTPPRYIDHVEVRVGDTSVFTLEGDISLSANPAIGFGLIGKPGDIVTVVATDSAGAKWEQHFVVPAA